MQNIENPGRPVESSAGSSLKKARKLMRREIKTAWLVGLALNLLVLSSPIYMLQIFDRVLTTGHVETLVS